MVQFCCHVGDMIPLFPISYLMPLFSLSVVLDVEMPLYVFFWIIYIVYVAATKTLPFSCWVCSGSLSHCHNLLGYDSVASSVPRTLKTWRLWPLTGLLVSQLLRASPPGRTTSLRPERQKNDLNTPLTLALSHHQDQGVETIATDVSCVCLCACVRVPLCFFKVASVSLRPHPRMSFC